MSPEVEKIRLSIQSLARTIDQYHALLSSRTIFFWTLVVVMFFLLVGIPVFYLWFLKKATATKPLAQMTTEQRIKWKQEREQGFVFGTFAFIYVGYLASICYALVGLAALFWPQFGVKEAFEKLGIGIIAFSVAYGLDKRKRWGLLLVYILSGLQIVIWLIAIIALGIKGFPSVHFLELQGMAIVATVTNGLVPALIIVYFWKRQKWFS